MSKKRPPNAERDYMASVAELGCLICWQPAEVHHKTGAGMGMRASNYDTMPLCPRHHRTGGHGFAIHAGTETWEAKYGLQDEHIKMTKRMLNHSDKVGG